MTDLHPLTDLLLHTEMPEDDVEAAAAIDATVRKYLHRDTLLVSGVKFADHPDTEVEVAGTFIESGNQIQMALIGSEPVILVQPEYDADADKVTLVTTTVDLPPAGLVEVLETLLDATKEIVVQQREQTIVDMVQGAEEHDISVVGIPGVDFPIETDGRPTTLREAAEYVLDSHES